MQNKKQIVLADDDPFVREMIGEILEDLGYTTKFAEEGQQALDILKEEPVDAIITDMHMPVMDGMTLIEQVRIIDKDIPLIILTVDSEISTAVEAIKKGADDYLIKGSTIGDTLPIALAKVMQLYALKMENKDLIHTLSKKNAELERLAFLDALTSIANRRHFDIILRSEWEKAVKKQGPISLIMTDIDKFKIINDTLGHKFGDICLHHAARAMNRALRRSSDFLARYGGDEFAVILPDTTMTQAKEIAERIRLVVREEEVKDPQTSISRSLTMSFGVFGLVPDTNEDTSVLLQGADKALYKAKHLGRDQVQVWELGQVT